MTAGYNNTGRIWRFTANTNNDDVGGAVPTGTVLYTPVFSRIASERPTLALLEQGLETPEIFRAELSYVAYSPTGTFDVLHNDQYEVMWPPVSPFYRKRFVIIGIQHNSYNDSRKFLRVTMRRIETANSDLLLNSVNGLNFNNVNSNVTIPASSSINNLPLGDFTIEFSANIPSGTGTGCYILDKGDAVDVGMTILVYPQYSIAFMLVADAAYNNWIERDIDISTFVGVKRHYEFVYLSNNNTMKIFVDGIEQPFSFQDGAGNLSAYSDSAFNIILHNLITGYTNVGLSLYWMIISNTARHTANFTPPSLSICPSTSDSYTVLRLALDEGTGTIAHDSSDNTNNGLIVGATWQVTE